jgi:hypothetical protein
MSAPRGRLVRRVSGFGVLTAVALGLAMPGAGADPEPVTVTGPTPAEVVLGAASSVPGASVTGFPAGARLVISVDNGTLSLPAGAAGLTVPDGYADLGDPSATLAVEGSEQDLNAALDALTWLPATTGGAVISVDAAPKGVAYDPVSGHHLEVVDAGGRIAWTAARDAAAARTVNGSPGYLATVTSPAEQAFVTGLTDANVWVGGQRGSRGRSWAWATGPEAGSTYWLRSCGTGFQGTCPGAGFAQWAAGQPVAANNGAGMQLDGTTGLWSASSRRNANVSAYLVEYGSPDDQPLYPVATSAMNVVPPVVETVPGAPTAVAALPGESSATVAWTAPDYEGSSPLMGYAVMAIDAAGEPGPTCPAPASATSCVVVGLTNGDAYTFEVVAINAAGTSLPSTRSDVVTPRFATTLSLAGVPATATEGDQLDLVATAATTSPGAATPTGSVTFHLDGAELGTVVLDAGTAHLPTAALAAGTHILEVSFPGDLAFAPAVNAAASVDVTSPAPTTTAPPTTQPPTTKGPVTAPPTTRAPSTTAPTTVPETTTTVPGTTVPETTVATDSTTPSSTTAPLTPKLTIVFGVGVDAKAEGARVTVRGQGLEPGSSTEVTVHSDPVVLATIVVPKSGAFEQDVLLPHLEDGEHRIVASGTTAKGGAIERQYPFAVAGGTLSRIGAAYEVAVPAGNATPTEGGGAAGVVTDQPAAEPTSSGGGFPVVPALLVLVAVGGLGFLVWRIRQRRAEEAGAAGERTSSVASGPLNLRGVSTSSTVGAGRGH